MKNSEKYQKAFSYFKESYTYKMGGTQTVILPNGKEQYFDDREYYSGRGAKYNSSIKHDDKGIIQVAKKDYSLFLSSLRGPEIARKERLENETKKAERLQAARDRGIYDLIQVGESKFVALSSNEEYSKIFDASRLAATLGISVEDASLLSSEGKSYVFAKSTDGNTYELYHPSLSCNSLVIRVSVATPERVSKFKPHEWQSAPYAKAVGQTEKINHFVC